MSDFTVGKIVFAPKVDEQDEKLVNELIAVNKKPEKLVSMAELLQTIERQQFRIADQQAEIERLNGIINEINSWAVCGGITSPEDMMQNLPRIVEITTIDQALKHE